MKKNSSSHVTKPKAAAGDKRRVKGPTASSMPAVAPGAEAVDDRDWFAKHPHDVNRMRSASALERAAYDLAAGARMYIMRIGAGVVRMEIPPLDSAPTNAAGDVEPGAKRRRRSGAKRLTP